MEGVSETKKTGPKACATCAKAKARCIPCNNPLKCERCDRLDKPCSKQTPAPPRVRKEAKTTKVAQLEKRLESLLQVTKVQPEDSAVRGRVKKQCFAHDISFPWLIPEQDHDMKMLESPPAEDIRESSDISQTLTRSTSSTSLEPSWPEGEEASALLKLFRAKSMALFPFVIVPPGMPSEQLRQDRPFMWKAVMLEACYINGHRQLTLGRELLKELTEALFTKPKESLDILQGLLLYLAWFHYGLTSFQVTSLLGLARSICLTLTFSNGQFDTTRSDFSSLCLEQMRAFAGTYYLNTAVFTTSKRADAFMNTTYLEAICRILGRQMEYGSDEILIHYIKIQQLAHSISSTLTATNSSLQLSILPIIMVVKSFQAQIEEFKATLPPHLQNNSSLMGHIYVAEILLCEVGLQENQYDAGNLQPTERLEVLWSLLGAVKSFFALRFDNPITGPPKFICISSIDFMYTFITCLKLISFEAPGWDLTIVRQDLALEDLIERQIRDIEHMTKRRDLQQTTNGSPQGLVAQKPDPISKALGMLKSVRAVLQIMPQTPPALHASATQAPTPPSGDDAIGGMDPSWAVNSDMWQELMERNVLNPDWSSVNSSPFGFQPDLMLN